MKRLIAVLLLSALTGHIAGYVRSLPAFLALAAGRTQTQAQTQGRAPVDPNALPPAIPPVPNPPLYPDSPQNAAYWDIDDIRKIFEARRAAAEANPDQGFGGAPLPPGTP